MPPRKKFKAGSVASGANTTTAAASFQELPQLQKDVLNLVEGMFGLRHARDSDIHEEPKNGLVPQNGLYPYPVNWGGTFVDIAQRAWQDPDQLIRMSADLAFKVGMMDANDDDEFIQQFCKMDVSRITVQTFPQKTFSFSLMFSKSKFEQHVI